FAGTIDITQQTRFSGFEGNLLVRTSPCSACKFYAGLRYLNLEDDLNINQSTTVLPGGNAFFLGGLVRSPNGLNLLDQFSTRNRFFGGQVGLARTFQLCDRLSLDVGGKFALGSTQQEYSIRGSTSLVSPAGVVTTARGGLLALGSNIGDYNRDQVS